MTHTFWPPWLCSCHYGCSAFSPWTTLGIRPPLSNPRSQFMSQPSLVLTFFKEPMPPSYLHSPSPRVVDCFQQQLWLTFLPTPSFTMWPCQRVESEIGWAPCFDQQDVVRCSSQYFWTQALGRLAASTLGLRMLILGKANCFVGNWLPWDFHVIRKSKPAMWREPIWRKRDTFQLPAVLAICDS